MRTPIAMILLLSVASELVAQCLKPPIPTLGLPVVELADERVTYADGYRTLARLVRPAAAAPSCGWPLVVVVHGLGGGRGDEVTLRRALAGRGYAVWSYDVRGQGDARALNAPTDGFALYGIREKYDLAEQVAHARRAHAATVAADRLAVLGSSQGGIHAWFAAAHSGATLTIPGRGSVRFPRVDAVVPRHFVADPVEFRLRGGTWFGAPLIELCADPANPLWIVDGAVRKQVRDAFTRRDPAGLQAAWDAEPGRRVTALLARSAVPVLYTHAPFDRYGSPLLGLRALAAMPPATPRRAIVSTGGHGSATNGFEAWFQDEAIVRWLDRFLWRAPQAVEREARLISAPVPLDAATRADPAALWGQRYDPDLTPGDLVARRLYTHASGRLDPQAPSAPGAPTAIAHRVAVSFTPQVYLADPQRRTPAAILRDVPLSARGFTAAPLAVTGELAGSPRVRAVAVPDAARFGLAALLVARLPGATSDVLLAHGGAGVLDASAGVPRAVDIELSPVFAVLPAGTALRLVLQNHWLRQAPLAGFVTVPYFTPSKLRIRHGSGADATRVDLPFRRAVRAELRTPFVAAPHGAPADVPLIVDGGPDRGGWRYFVAVGVSGHAAPTPLPGGGALALSRDPLTDALLGLVNTPLLPGFAGALDSRGRAGASLRLALLGALPAELRDARLSLAAWLHRGVLDLRGAGTNPVDLWLR